MPEPIRFDRELYEDDAVRQAVEAFSGLATLTVEESTDALVVHVAEPDPRYADVLADELANHALFHTAAAQRLGAGSPA